MNQSNEKRSDEALEYRKKYKSVRWQKLRAWHLRNSPLCVFCLEEGIAKPADVVDHKTAHKGKDALFWSNDNLQSLCKRCHDSTKQKMERNDKPITTLSGWPLETMTIDD